MKRFNLVLAALCLGSVASVQAAGLSEAAIKSMALTGADLPCGKGAVKLKKGKAHCGEESLEVYHVSFGDLNGDGVRDAAVNLMGVPDGGNGRDGILLAVLDVGGKPKHVASVNYGLDYVPADVQTMAIQNGEVVLNLLGTGENDSHCCPTQKVKEIYRLENGRLVLVKSHK